MKDEESGQADPSVRRYQRTYRWAGARLSWSEKQEESSMAVGCDCRQIHLSHKPEHLVLFNFRLKEIRYPHLPEYCCFGVNVGSAIALTRGSARGSDLDLTKIALTMSKK